MINSARYFLLLILLIPQFSHSEVLDKFGGCARPAILKFLLFFAFGIFVLSFFKKYVLARWTFILSTLLIGFFELLPFIASLGIFDGYTDPAKLSYFDELNSCPQYNKLSYWNQVWASVGIYLFFAIVFLFRKKK